MNNYESELETEDLVAVAVIFESPNAESNTSNHIQIEVSKTVLKILFNWQRYLGFLSRERIQQTFLIFPCKQTLLSPI